MAPWALSPHRFLNPTLGIYESKTPQFRHLPVALSNKVSASRIIGKKNDSLKKALC
jgi:hypothetical protein